MKISLIGYSVCIAQPFSNGMHKDNFFVQKTQSGNNEMLIGVDTVLTTGVVNAMVRDILIITFNFVGNVILKSEQPITII